MRKFDANIPETAGNGFIVRCFRGWCFLFVSEVLPSDPIQIRGGRRINRGFSALFRTFREDPHQSTDEPIEVPAEVGINESKMNGVGGYPRAR
ncbi:MAG: hypothetical protein ACTSQ8_16450 [Candidatus Helarchaeota archaeon]